jgi:CDP-diacylglycerol--glycerol-3-phosphate 3-phosphatidyltransferase
MQTLLLLLRNIPNALSAARIGATPVLGYFAAAGAEHYFTWVLVPALLSDIADGFIARRFGLTSRLGALLDSIGDALLFFVALFGVLVFYPELLHAHVMAGLLLMGSWIVEIAAALIRYRRLSSFHTYLSKAAAYLLGISIGVLFLWGLPAALLYVAVTASVVANLEELVLIWLLPQWRPNVRGLYWVLQERRRSAA